MLEYNSLILLENIKAICNAKNKSLTALERELGFSVPSISKWKDGNPTLSKVLQVANALGVSIEYLLTSDFYNNQNLKNLFLESVYQKTDTHEIQWSKITKEDNAPEYYHLANDNRILSDYDDDSEDFNQLANGLYIYSALVDNATIYCVFQEVSTNFEPEDPYYTYYYFAIKQENFLNFIEDANHKLIEKIYKKIIHYLFELPRQALDDFMLKFINQ
ncbi:helix-turn-helix domain-containing protein [Lacrimispora xylanisolvens]|uniref:helix-turn-helix domain-containing protein n=1 Tax=Lacrimispora xylanisolvens TaxID=384636 RepID=UPI0024029806